MCCLQLTKSMGGIVKSMDKVMGTMNLEKSKILVDHVRENWI